MSPRKAAFLKRQHPGEECPTNPGLKHKAIGPLWGDGNLNVRTGLLSSVPPHSTATQRPCNVQKYLQDVVLQVAAS